MKDKLKASSCWPVVMLGVLFTVILVHTGYCQGGIPTLPGELPLYANIGLTDADLLPLDNNNPPGIGQSMSSETTLEQTGINQPPDGGIPPDPFLMPISSILIWHNAHSPSLNQQRPPNLPPLTTGLVPPLPIIYGTVELTPLSPSGLSDELRGLGSGLNWAAAIPEPQSWWLLTGGLSYFSLRMRRRRAAERQRLEVDR